ncbi:Homoserine/homoserine lactone efflux protein [Curvibacter sp. AEP1-3]|nr:Homoserine/homoserine lactone efflux protein [Curvibacter sp. AEP1-3]
MPLSAARGSLFVACYNRGLRFSLCTMELSTWLAFFAASWAISISPGAGAVAAMSAGLNHGFRRGYITTIGLVLGIWTQILVVGVGLGAVVAASSAAFLVIKWAGVAYLVWLGIQQWRAPAVPLAAKADEAVPASVSTQIFKAWVINALNPKGTVFLLAVVPQFLNLSQALTPQYMIIGATLAFTDLVVMGCYTAVAAKVLRALKSESHLRTMNRVFGGLFVAAGTLLALFKRTT